MSQFTVLPEQTVNATNPSVGTNGATAPTSSTEVAGVNPSGNLQPLQTDVSGNLLVSVQSAPTPQNINLTEVGGAAISEGQNTMANSLPVAIASNQSTLPVSAASLPLPTGAATSANQTNSSQKTQIVDGSGNVIASTSNALNVDVINFPATQPVSGTVTVVQPTGTNLHAVIDSGTVVVTQPTAASLNATIAPLTSSSTVTVVQPTGTNLHVVTDSTSTTAVTQATAASLNATVTQGPASNAAGAWTAKITDGTNTAAVKAASTAPIATDPALVVSISPNTSLNTTTPKTATSAVTSVASSATTVSLLASNASRNGATFFNESTSILYLKFGATASLTSYTVQIAGGGYFEMPPPVIYTGAIDGIWSSANGNVRITELS